jgi:hypothetical protein
MVIAFYPLTHAKPIDNKENTPMIPIRVIHTHGRPPRETEVQMFQRLAAERRRSRRRERRGELLRGVRPRLT